MPVILLAVLLSLAAAVPARAGSATLQWNPVSGASGYRVFQATTSLLSDTTQQAMQDDSILKATVATPATSYAVSGLSPATTYYFRVAAYDPTGTQSGLNVDAVSGLAVQASTFVPPLPVGPVQINALAPPMTAGDRNWTAFNTYLLNNPAIDGVNPTLAWNTVETSSGVYDFSTFDSQLQRFYNAGKTVNLIVKGITNGKVNSYTPAYVFTAAWAASLGAPPLDVVSCNQSSNYPVVYETPYKVAYENFISTVIAHYANNPHIGYIRFGLSVGGEVFPHCIPEMKALPAPNTFTENLWLSWINELDAFEQSKNPTMRLMAALDQVGSDLKAGDVEASSAVLHDQGFGCQGLVMADVQAYSAGQICTADWCAMFDKYQGQVPLELQQYDSSTANSPTSVTGVLSDIFPFTIARHATIYEVYVEDLLTAYDPNWPGSAQYGALYSQAYANARQGFVGAPTSSSLSPSSATVGGASFTLTVDGGNFAYAATVNWNGAPLATTYIGGTRLTATVPAAKIASAGTASVTIFNPAPGGGTSAALSFNITGGADKMPPSVAVSAPANGSVVSGILPLSGTSSDNVAVSSVSVSLDGGAYSLAIGTGSWTFGVDTRLLSNGSHSASVQAVDGSGNAASASVSFSVSNATPAYVVAPEFFGLDVNKTSTPWPVLPFKILRLWDSQTRWNQINASNGSFDWTTLDAWLANAQAHGQDVLYTFGGVPSWISSNPGDTACGEANGGCDPPTDLNADGSGTDASFQTFVSSLVAHAGARIKYYEVWNEVNNVAFWNGTAQQLVRMTQDARAIIKAAQPGALVLSPDTCNCDNTHLTGKKTTNPQDGMDVFLSTRANGISGAAVIDAVAFHPYLGSSSPNGILNLISKMKTVMNSRGVGNLLLWDTESSWGKGHNVASCTDSPPYTAACQDNMAAFLAQSFSLAAGAGLDRYSWYQYDNGTWGTLYSASNGGLQEGGTAYVQVNNWLSGASASPCSSAGTVWTCGLTKVGGYQGAVVWDSNGPSSYSVPSIYGQYRDLNGSTIVMPGGGLVTIGNKPFLFENIFADTTPPTVAISAPANGSTVSGTITVSGTSSDNVAISSVELSLDGGSYAVASGTAAWSYALATAGLSNGPHSISARATDSSGNAASASISITVLNGTLPWSGILDPSRAVDWSQAGIPGDIPNRTTVCSTLSPGATAAQITAAINACPANQVVYLNPGTYNLSDTIYIINHNNVTLRGAGADQTKLVFSGNTNGCSGLGSHICIWNNDNNYTQSPHNTANWTAGYAKGATSITLDSKTNMQVGTVLILDQLDDANADTGNIWVCQTQGLCSNEIGSGSGRTGRAQQQLVTVTSISGSGPYTVGISSGLYMPNWRSSQSPGAWYSSNPPITGVGIESLSIDGSANGAIGALFYNASQGWVKGVASIKADKAHVEFYQSPHIVVRDSYFYQTYNAATESYGISPFESSDDLIENNIFQQVVSPLSVNGSGSGSVYAYNYSIDDYYTNPTWMMGAAWLHSAGVDNLLMEGNVGAGFTSDDIHGSHHFITNFRNYWNGWESGKNQQTVPIHVYSYGRYMNVIGNVLGRAGYHNNYACTATSATSSCPQGDTSIYTLGYSGNDGQHGGYNDDPSVATTLMRWGNYDTVHSAVQWNAAEVPSGLNLYANPVPATRTLPASFYAAGKPSWWDATPWPPIGPDVNGGNLSGVGGHVNQIPAGNCYANVMHGPSDGTGSPLIFNAATCYSTSSDTTPPTLAISAPANGSTVSGTITVSGTAADNVAVSSVAVSIDGGAYSNAAGTSSWTFSLNSLSLTNANHTITARAVDTSGNAATVSISVIVSNAVGSSPVPASLFGAGWNNVSSFNNSVPVWCPTDSSSQTAAITGFRVWDDGQKWGQIETAAGAYNWSVMDKIANTLATNPGCPMHVLYTFGDTPSWASICSGSGDPSTCLPGPTSGGYGGGTQCASPGDYSCTPPSDVNADGSGTDAQYQAFVNALVSRYAGRIAYYEVWNEPDSPNFWCTTAGCGSSGASLSRLVRMGWDLKQIVHCVDPSAQIVGPSFHGPSALSWMHNYATTSVSAPAGSVGSCSWPAQTITGAQTFDITNFHGRGANSNNVNPESFLTVYSSAATEIANDKLPTAFFDDENGYLGTAQAANPDIQASYVARSYVLRASVNNPPILQSYWYEWDAGQGPLQGTIVGLAYDTVAHWMIGGTMGACAENGTVYTCPLTQNGVSELIAWDTAQNCDSGCTTAPHGFGAGYTTYVDLTGASNATTGGNGTVPLGLKPLLLQSSPASLGAAPFTAVSSASLTANWTSTFPQATFYYARLSTAPFPNSFSGNKSSNTLNFFATFKGLSPNTTYYAQVSTAASGPFTSLGSARTLSNGTDTIPPTITITAPASTTTLSGAVTISGTASDNVAVSSVAVSIDGGAYALAAGTKSWTFNLNTLPLKNSNHAITTRATDTSGNSSTSTVTYAVFNDTAAPTIALSSPVNGAVVRATVTVSGTAADNVGLASVDVAVDSGYYALATGTSIWTYDVNTLALTDGIHTITARAHDAAGNISTTTVSITVDNTAPVVSAIASVNIGSTAATITWITNEPATSRVEYGTSTSYGIMTTLNSTLVSSHSVTLGNLSASTSYHYRVRSKDAAGNLALSADQTFTTKTAADTTPPTVAISSPANGSTVSGSITVTGTAGDDVNVSSVGVSVDGGAYALALGTKSWTFNLNTLPLKNSNHTITARATDTSGNSSTSTVTYAVFNDTVAPTIALSSPINGAVVRATVTVSGTAADNVGVASVDVAIDSGSYSLATGTSVWTYNLNTQALTDGAHTITARAKDAAGNAATSAVSITVDNTAPVVSAVSSVGIGSAAATITWTTNEPATSRVEYGTTTAYGTFTAYDPALMKSHGVGLSGLSASTLYHFRVRSRDAADNLALSSDNSFTTSATPDITPPTAAITAPSSTATLSGTVTISGTASDDVNVSSVGVSIDGGAYAVAAGTKNWTLSLNTLTLTNAKHTITARATDTSGNSATASVTYSVSNDTVAPSVAITFPGNGAVLSGIVIFSGSSSDNVAVSSVGVSFDGGAYILASGTKTWTYTFDTRTVPNGAHTVTARAVDASGNSRIAVATYVFSNVIKPRETPGLMDALVYPNPAPAGKTPTIRAFLGVVDHVDVSVFDVTGRLVNSGSVDGPPTGIADGNYYYDYPWTGPKASGSYFAVIHGKASDGTIVRARVRFAVVH